MDINDKELFESATADEPVNDIVETPVEQPEPQVVDQGQPRDESGRFVAAIKTAHDGLKEEASNPEAPVSPLVQKEEAHIPSWRLREEREAREAAERRASEIEARLVRQMAELQSKLPKAEPEKRPDLYEDPDGFVGHGVRQAVDPIRSEMQQQREFFSQQLAMRDHGAEKVQAAYKWIEEGFARRDPDAIATYNRAMQSMHPYDAIVKAHQQREVYQQIGGDPAAYFEKTLEAKLSDPAFAGALMQKIQQSARGAVPQASGKPNIQLPPSLNRVPSAQSAADDNENDVSDAAMFRFATR